MMSYILEILGRLPIICLIGSVVFIFGGFQAFLYQEISDVIGLFELAWGVFLFFLGWRGVEHEPLGGRHFKNLLIPVFLVTGFFVQFSALHVNSPGGVLVFVGAAAVLIRFIFVLYDLHQE
jgi:hypothetical protein